MPTTNYNLRIDKELKERAFAVFESYGLTPSQAIKLFLNQVADTNSVPLSFNYQSQPDIKTILAHRSIIEDSLKNQYVLEGLADHISKSD